VWDAGHIRRRIRELAGEDPGLKRFGASRHRYRLGPTLTETAVRRFEAMHEISFPPSYRTFLLEVGDGGAGPYYGLFRHDGSEENWKPRRLPCQYEPGSLARPFPHISGFSIPDPVPPCAVHPSAAADGEDPCWWNGSITVSEIGCGAFCRLVVTGPTTGQVWFEDFDSEDLLSPGPDFYEWYMSWLENPGVIHR
jgi:SMI1 / KNR4 family (SUKH-1)